LYKKLREDYISEILLIDQIEVEIENVIKTKCRIMNKGFVQKENSKQVVFKSSNDDMDYYEVVYKSFYYDIKRKHELEEIPLVRLTSYYLTNPNLKIGQIINFNVKYISGSSNKFYPESDYFDDYYVFNNHIDDNFKSNSNCFIVTTTMGDINHPVVVDYRRYRDEVLLNTFIGRLFIDLYYKVGPVLSKVIKTNSFLFTISKKLVLSIHKRLR
jgi:hypothetical protein